MPEAPRRAANPSPLTPRGGLGLALLLALAAVAPATAAEIPKPASVFGFAPGDDYHIADYAQMRAYFAALAAATPRVRLEPMGKTGYGNEMFAAIISSEQNMRDLDLYRSIVQKLASGTLDEASARKLASEGKAVVWIDGGLHSTEVAGAQHSPVIAYTVASEESDEMRRIRNDVILVLCPVLNPDGLDLVAHWYGKNLNTPYETAPMVELWNRYTGHDNNRDWYSFNQVESRNTARLLYEEWFPQIVYNQHQTAPYPARIIVPPYDDPTNPNIPPDVLRGVNLVGTAMAKRFEEEHKAGVVSFMSFDTWWNGGMRTAPYYHNMVGILTETAGFLAGYASPGYAAPDCLPKTFMNGLSAREPSTFYPDPWKGGWWRLRDAVDYMVTGDMAVLDLASRRRDAWLFDFWRMNHEQIELGGKGTPYAYLVPEKQWNKVAAADMVFSLATGGIEVREATAPFTAGGKPYDAGTLVLLAGQPFRPFLVDLMEPQHYPDLRTSPGGPPKRPYDMTGWTLPLQMGVDVVRVDEVVDIKTRKIAPKEPSHHFVPSEAGRLGKTCLYVSWDPPSDAGWTEWIFDRYGIPYEILRDADVRAGDLHRRCDTVVLPDQPADGIESGWKSGETLPEHLRDEWGPTLPGVQRPQYTGGLGHEGALALKRLVEDGGHLVALGDATEFAIDALALPARNALAHLGPTKFFAPGSLIRIDVDPSLPETRGMQQNSVAFFVDSPAFELWDDRTPPSPLRYSDAAADDPLRKLGDHGGIRTLAVYAKSKPLASGWLLGEEHLEGKVAAASLPFGKGRVVLIGFRCQFRGQSENTFPLLFNSLVLEGQGGAAARP
jgi:hypothetical protein